MQLQFDRNFHEQQTFKLDKWKKNYSRSTSSLVFKFDTDDDTTTTLHSIILVMIPVHHHHASLK